MFKGVILNSLYDEESGATFVQKQTQYGTYEGMALCMDEDADVQNEWDGYTIAEMKCDMQAQKFKITYMKQRLLGVEQLIAYIDYRDKQKFGEKIDNSDTTLFQYILDYANMLAGQIEREEARLSRMKETMPGCIDNILNQRREFRKQHCK